ncbi:MAG: hypothetical protein VYD25_09220 [Pseudomonadota bacterium]|nr:hypothetical protein [Pseudomonadota bacterium]
MSRTHRERVLAALNHEETDRVRVPIDLGGSYATSIVIDAYEALKQHLNFTHETGVLSRMYQLAYPDDSILEYFDVDTRPINPVLTRVATSKLSTNSPILTILVLR